MTLSQPLHKCVCSHKTLDECLKHSEFIVNVTYLDCKDLDTIDRLLRMKTRARCYLKRYDIITNTSTLKVILIPIEYLILFFPLSSTTIFNTAYNLPKNKFVSIKFKFSFYAQKMSN